MMKKERTVVFDTNSYRQFVAEKTKEEALKDIEKIQALERTKNITASGIMVVTMEMLGNLTEGETGVNYKDCLNGLLVMMNHCIDVQSGGPRIIPQPHLHICKAFFGRLPLELENKVRNLVGVAHDLHIDLEQSLAVHTERNTFEMIKNWIDKEEFDFSEHLIELVEGIKLEVKTQYPKIKLDKERRKKALEFINSRKFDGTLAYALILTAATDLGLTFKEEELWDRVNKMLESFPMSVGFFKWICHEIVDKNIDMRSKKSRAKRWNWQWDYQVSFLINDSTIANREVILVTSDNDLLDMMNDFGYKHKVMTIMEYIQYLHQPLIEA